MEVSHSSACLVAWSVFGMFWPWPCLSKSPGLQRGAVGQTKLLEELSLPLLWAEPRPDLRPKGPEWTWQVKTGSRM